MYWFKNLSLMRMKCLSLLLNIFQQEMDLFLIFASHSFLMRGKKAGIKLHRELEYFHCNKNLFMVMFGKFLKLVSTSLMRKFPKIPSVILQASIFPPNISLLNALSFFFCRLAIQSISIKLIEIDWINFQQTPHKSNWLIQSI